MLLYILTLIPYRVPLTAFPNLGSLSGKDVIVVIFPSGKKNSGTSPKKL